MTHKTPVSKSHYISGTQCHLRLWYDSYARELAATPDDALLRRNGIERLVEQSHLALGPALHF